MRFKSQQHKSTFKKALRKKDKTDNKLMAAMYLLTEDQLGSSIITTTNTVVMMICKYESLVFL